jgi:excisionase family DNA binding protein
MMSVPQSAARPGHPPPDPVLHRLSAMERLLAAVSAALPTMMEKLDLLRELLANRRKFQFTTDEVAEMTGRSGYTIRRWIAEGKLKAIRVAEGGPRGRLLIPRSELERLVGRGLGAQVPTSALDVPDHVEDV